MLLELVFTSKDQPVIAKVHEPHLPRFSFLFCLIGSRCPGQCWTKGHGWATMCAGHNAPIRHEAQVSVHCPVRQAVLSKLGLIVGGKCPFMKHQIIQMLGARPESTVLELAIRQLSVSIPLASNLHKQGVTGSYTCASRMMR